MFEFPMLANAALKSTVVLAAASVIAWSLRKRSAAARHLVWTAAAAALLALPILSTLRYPRLRIPAKTAGAMAVFRVFSSAHTGTSSSPSLPGVGPAGGGRRDGEAAVRRQWLAPYGPRAPASDSCRCCSPGQRCGAYGAAPVRSTAPRVAGSLGIEHRVDVLEAARTGMPMTFGIFRPTVLLPAGASEWNPERLRIVLLHELAHVRRGDVAMHLLARTALALYWWNPLAWFAWREFLKERERATDDLVLHAGARASEYAGHLLEVARTLQPATATAWAAIAMARRSQLEGRLPRFSIPA